MKIDLLVCGWLKFNVYKKLGKSVKCGARYELWIKDYEPKNVTGKKLPLDFSVLAYKEASLRSLESWYSRPRLIGIQKIPFVSSSLWERLSLKIRLFHIVFRTRSVCFILFFVQDPFVSYCFSYGFIRSRSLPNIRIPLFVPFEVVTFGKGSVSKILACIAWNLWSMQEDYTQIFNIRVFKFLHFYEIWGYHANFWHWRFRKISVEGRYLEIFWSLPSTLDFLVCAKALGKFCWFFLSRLKNFAVGPYYIFEDVYFYTFWLKWRMCMETGLCFFILSKIWHFFDVIRDPTFLLKGVLCSESCDAWKFFDTEWFNDLGWKLPGKYMKWFSSHQFFKIDWLKKSVSRFEARFSWRLTI